MLNELGEQDKAERDAIIAEIHVSFADVSRGEDAVSWNECLAHDNYEPATVREAARRSDKDKHWSELCDDPNWEPFPGVGGFSFINAEGFRYYLPPTMIRLFRSDPPTWHDDRLPGLLDSFADPHTSQLWSEPQLLCIARFVSFMARHDAAWDGPPNPWSDAIDRRWHAYLPK